jgi:hypothetical protein
VEQPALPDVPAPPAPSKEEVQALQAVFSAKPQEPSAAPALFGLWAGGMLAHDLLQDHLARQAEEEEPAEPDQPKG